MLPCFKDHSLRRSGCVYAEEGTPLTEAVFTVNPDDRYFRLAVIDEQGYAANTNAYYTSEWL